MPPRNRSLSWAVRAAVLAAACAGVLRAQSEEGLFYDTVDVNVVNLEVVVLDRDGRPVTGLRADDFEVLEDGRPVAITNFLAVEERVPQPAADPFAEPASVETQTLKVVVLVDEANLQSRRRGEIFVHLAAMLDDWDPRNQMMIVRLADPPQVLVGFTNDVQALRQAVGEIAARSPLPSRLELERQSFQRRVRSAGLPWRNVCGDHQPCATFESAVREAESLAREARVLAEQNVDQVRQASRLLAAFTDSLAGLRGRKALVYVSDGLPDRAGDAFVEAWRLKFEDWVRDQVIEELRYETSSLPSQDYSTSKDIAALIERAAVNKVAFYPIAYGERSTGAGSADVATDVIGALRIDQIEAGALDSTLLRLAEGTGGEAFLHRPDVDVLIGKALRDVSSFYSLGYSPERDSDDRFHELAVAVRGRRDVEVRSRRGFRETDPIDHLRDLTLAALTFGASDNPLGMTLDLRREQPGEKDRVKVSFEVRFPLRRFLLLPGEDHHTGQASLVLVVRDAEGRLSPMRTLELPIEIPNDQLGAALGGEASFPLDLEMRRGPQRIAVGLRDRLGRVDSILHLDVDVGHQQPSVESSL